MREDAVPTLEELVAKRDEVIEQLQGEWATRLNWRLLIRGALKWGWIAFLIVLALAVVASLFAFVVNGVLGTINMQDPVYMLLLYLLVYCAAVSLLAFFWALGYQVYTHRRRAIVIREDGLDWGEGEPTDLRKLYLKLHDPDSAESYRYGQTLMRALYRDQWGFLAANCIERFVKPSEFERGDELVELLKGVALVNDQIAEGVIEDTTAPKTASSGTRLPDTA
jgi:hypothetical protein